MTTHHISLQQSAPHWRQYARCLGANPELFYPSPDDPAEGAKYKNVNSAQVIPEKQS